jgi:hypothetical protein
MVGWVLGCAHAGRTLRTTARREGVVAGSARLYRVSMIVVNILLKHVSTSTGYHAGYAETALPATEPVHKRERRGFEDA